MLNSKLRLIEAVRSRKFETDVEPDVWKGIQAGTLRGTYKGLTLQKNPFDRVIYQELIQVLKPVSIIEIGSFAGGSARWLYDMCNLFELKTSVLSIDIRPPNLNLKGIDFTYGDAFAPNDTFPHEKIAKLPHPWLVISDSAHVYDTEIAILNYFAGLLNKGDYIVVEDGVVSDFGLDKYERFEDGPNRAVADFLAEHQEFEIDSKYCDFFGHNVTYCPNGWLYKNS